MYVYSRLLKLTCAALLVLFSAACSTFSGNSAVSAVSEDELATAQTRTAALETEVARLKTQNARLANALLAIQRERDATEELAQVEPDEGDRLSDPALPPKPEILVQEKIEQPSVVVDDAASPALARTDVPVEQAPRLVQPTFASTETVFENEASEIKTASILYGVHLASYRGMEEARTGWRQLQRENPDELGLLEPRIETVMVEGKGKFLRLVGGGLSSEETASALCAQLKAKGLFCSVAGFEGNKLSLAESEG